jgi:ribonuclease P protein component
MRFLKSDRLLSERDFSYLLKKAHEGSARDRRIFRCAHFKVYWDAGEAKPRLGLTVPKKVLKSAVLRNRVKRCLREFFRHHKDQLRGDFLVRLEHAAPLESCDAFTSPLKELFPAMKRGRQES